MKRTITILALALLASAAGAEEKTKTYIFNDIESVEAEGNYKVYVTKGDSPEVEVRFYSELQKYMIVNYSDYHSRLSLRLEELPRKFRNRELPAIEVHIQMDKIREIDLSGASEIYFDGEFSTDQLDADLSGASNLYDLAVEGRELVLDCSGASNAFIDGNFTSYIDIDCSGACNVRFDGEAGKLDGDFSGASKIELGGAANDVKIDASGACSINAGNFKAKVVKVNLSGVSSAKVHATEELYYDVPRSCKMTYYGDAQLFNLSEENNIVKGSF